MGQGFARWLVAVAAFAGLALASPEAGAQEPSEDGLPFHERDFALNPALAARLHDFVVLELEPALWGRGRRVRENLARYQLEQATYVFCLDEDDPHLVSLIVENAWGKRVLRLDRHHLKRHHLKPRRPGPARGDRQCKQVRLQAGVYHLRIGHDTRGIEDAPRLAFTQMAPLAPRLVDDQGQPVGGLWALRPDPALDPQRRQGRLAAPPPDQSVPGTSYTRIRPLIADFASPLIDDSALFDVGTLSRPVVGSTRAVPLNLARLDQSGDYTAFADDGPTGSGPFFQGTPLVVTDLGGYRARLGVERRTTGQLATFFLGQTTFSGTTAMLDYDGPGPDPPALTVDVLFRFFPAGTAVDTLQEGEVAVFQACNYQGNAAIFVADTRDFAALSSSVISLDRTAASIRLGNNTAVFLNSGPLYTGVRQLVTADTPCLASTPIGNSTTSSILVRPIAPIILLSSKKCEKCKLEGVDLTGTDLSGLDLQGADLTGATLANTVLSETKLQGATLTKAVLTGTSLTGADLSGAVLDQVTGLAGSDQSQAVLSNASLRQVDLRGAKLHGATLDQADLEGASLAGAFLTGAGNTQAASLIGAHLKNVNLANAHLSGANLSNASFYSTNPAGSGKCPVTNGFTESCATATGATLNNTQFGGAYLFGVDFTQTTIQGVQFNGAVLIAANFSGATISVDPRIGTNTGFSGAYLQGTSLGEATLSGTSLFNAFLDFRFGNSMFLLLNAKYSNFPSWHAPGQPICILVSYAAGTTAPTSNTTLTCPNGASAENGGCGPLSTTPPLNPNWASTLTIATSDPPASYLADSTYTPMQSRICQTLDPQW